MGKTWVLSPPVIKMLFILSKEVSASSKRDLIPYPAIVVGRRPLHDGADKKGLIAVDLLLTSHDAEAEAARGAPPQHNVFAAVKMPARTREEIKNTNLCSVS